MPYKRNIVNAIQYNAMNQSEREKYINEKFIKGIPLNKVKKKK